MLEDFKAKGGEVTKLAPGFAAGALQTSYSQILR
jgi:hypothetical protein